MKKLYQSPEVEVMNFAAAEKMAAINETMFLGLDDVGATVGGASNGDIPLD